MTEAALLDIRDLSVSFGYRGKKVTPVSSLTLSIQPGECVGLVGESGSGKTTLGLSMLRLLPAAHGMEVSGEIKFGDKNVLAMSPRELRAYRGQGVSMISQDPTTALNPTMTIGQQIIEAMHGAERGDVTARAVGLLTDVGIPDPAQRLSAYPHQLSGGMRQRVAIAIALANNPKLLIADEPTTALDVSVQLQILDLLAKLRREKGMALILITHALPTVARICERIVVLYAGQIVEDGPADTVLQNPSHWYTAGLIACARAAETDDGRFTTIEGAPPAFSALPEGCRFAPRCANVQDKCQSPPPLVSATTAARTRCWFPVPTS